MYDTNRKYDIKGTENVSKVWHKQKPWHQKNRKSVKGIGQTDNIASEKPKTCQNVTQTESMASKEPKTVKGMAKTETVASKEPKTCQRYGKNRNCGLKGTENVSKVWHKQKVWHQRNRKRVKSRARTETVASDKPKTCQMYGTNRKYDIKGTENVSKV
ncbi:unnamed protein product [Mytilus coruscus]|uniref:Uncharacterized protein n=1 Tax=Mytilus coruscus TaxID=42192 RepID=A0A6J8A7B1_MYTCO|nr:unnamed protein product [Mytilus coruscus]